MKELTANEILEIQNLYSRYNHASDSGDADRYAGCFTEAGVLDGSRRLEGRSALANYKRAEKASRENLYRQHWTGSLLIESCADGSVTGQCYFVAYNGVPGSLPYMTHCGSYIDRIVLENGKWLFAHRKLTHNVLPKA